MQLQDDNRLLMSICMFVSGLGGGGGPHILAFKGCLVHFNAIYSLTWQMHWNRHFWHCALLEAAIQSFHLLPIRPFVPEDQNTTVAFSSSGAKMFFIHKTFQPLTPWLDFICGYAALPKRPFSDSQKKQHAIRAHIKSTGWWPSNKKNDFTLL